MMDREKAIEILQRIADDKTEELHICDDEGGSVCGLILEEQNAILAGIEALKTERPRGKWIKGKEISRTMLIDETLYIDYENFTCSVCGLVLDRLLYHVDGSPFYKFCPNCGAYNLEEVNT